MATQSRTHPQSGTFHLHHLNITLLTILTSTTLLLAACTTPPNTTPDTATAPMNLAATPINRGAYITFTLGDDRGNPFINHAYTLDDGATWTAFQPPITTSPATITDLDNGTTYTIRLRANNVIGDSPPSDATTVTPRSVPDAPSDLVATPGNAEAAIIFTPGDDGGSPIVNHAYTLDDGATWTDFSPPITTSPATITGLTNGTTYTIGLRATTAAGNGPPSSGVTVTPATVPEAPTNLTATHGDAAARITFTPGDDGGSPLTNHAYSLDGGAWTDVEPITTTSPLIVTGLTNGTTYAIRLRALNAVGASQPSATVLVTPAVPSFAARAGGLNTDYGTAVAALPDGGAIVTGTYGGVATFGSATLTSVGVFDAFVARIDANGTWRWATSTGATSAANGIGVSALPDGGAIVTGYFTQETTFGSTTLRATSIDAFVAKIDAYGVWEWVTQVTGDSSEDLNAVSVLPDGTAIVTGQFRENATFGSTTLTGVGGEQPFVAKISADGEWLWVTAADATGASASALSVSALGDGGAVVTGFFSGTVAFGGTSLTADATILPFVARIGPSGAWTWAVSGGGTSATATSVTTFSDASAIVTGTHRAGASFGVRTLADGGSFVAKLNANGTWLWAIGTPTFSGYGSALPDGGAVVTGDFFGAASFGPTTITTENRDVYVARVDAAGGWLWALAAGGDGDDIGRAVSTFADGSAVVTGWITGTAQFGSMSLTSTGQADVLVAKTTPRGTW